jgi:hypothetical protein
MLRYYDPNSTFGTAGPHADFNIFQTALNNLGYPATCRNIAIISGSDLGYSQSPVDFVPGCDLIKLHEYYDKWYLFSLSIDMWAISNKLGTSTRVDQIDIDYYVVPFWEDLESAAHVFTFDNKPLDIAPGGYIDMTSDATQALADAGFNVNNFGRTQIDFVNTSSALDINPANYNDIFYTTVYKNYSFSMPPICYNRPDLVANNITPFDDVYSQGENCSHYELDYPYGPIMNKFGNIFDYELMIRNLYLQNKSINKTINYSSGNQITVGNNVESGTGRLSLNTGDVIVNSGGNLKLLAKNKITLKPGTKVNRGGKFYADVRSTGNLKSSNIVPAVPEIIEVEKGVYGTKHSENYESISWVINNNISLRTSKTYRPPADLDPGLYTLTCTTLTNGMPQSSSVVIKSDNDNNSFMLIKDNTNKITQLTTFFQILENPCKGMLKMKFQLSDPSLVNIEMVNTYGIVVNNYVNPSAQTGYTYINLDVSRFKSGIYYIRFISNSGSVTNKVLIY